MEFQIEIRKEVLSIDSNYYRRTEVGFLVSNPIRKIKIGMVV
jgi:GDP-D-mannose dehydratase